MELYDNNNVISSKVGFLMFTFKSIFSFKFTLKNKIRLFRYDQINHIRKMIH